MAELYPTDAELAALSGTNDAGQEVLFIPTGQSPYHLSFYKMLHRLLDVARRAGDLRVFKDGDLTFGVRAGMFVDGITPVTYAGSAGNALVDDATNYVYLTAAGVLVINQSGFPDPAVTAHLPLATITTAAGDYALADIADYRGRSMFAALGPPAPVDIQLMAGLAPASAAVLAVLATNHVASVSSAGVITGYTDDTESTLVLQRGLALRNAVTAHAAGDTLYLNAGDYALGNNTIAWDDQMHIVGMGISGTRVLSRARLSDTGDGQGENEGLAAR